MLSCRELVINASDLLDGQLTFDSICRGWTIWRYAGVSRFIRQF